MINQYIDALRDIKIILTFRNASMILYQWMRTEARNFQKDEGNECGNINHWSSRMQKLNAVTYYLPMRNLCNHTKEPKEEKNKPHAIMRHHKSLQEKLRTVPSKSKICSFEIPATYAGLSQHQISSQDKTEKNYDFGSYKTSRWTRSTKIYRCNLQIVAEFAVI